MRQRKIIFNLGKFWAVWFCKTLTPTHQILNHSLIIHVSDYTEIPKGIVLKPPLHSAARGPIHRWVVFPRGMNRQVWRCTLVGPAPRALGSFLAGKKPVFFTLIVVQHLRTDGFTVSLPFSRSTGDRFIFFFLRTMFLWKKRAFI